MGSLLAKLEHYGVRGGPCTPGELPWGRSKYVVYGGGVESDGGAVNLQRIIVLDKMRAERILMIDLPSRMQAKTR